MWSIALSLLGVCACQTIAVAARGVTPYLPLNTSPAMERKIERLLMLSGKPVVRRPIPAAVVQDALSEGCNYDASLCEEVRAYLERYMGDHGITQVSAEIALFTGESDQPIPNAHGLDVDEPGQISLSAYYQPSDYLLLGAGALVQRERITPTGSLISAGVSWAQLDIGYRDHWLSPSADGSFLIGTEAATMPSITLSNYQPIGPMGINYELFLARMSKSDRISHEGGTTSGYPRLVGMQLGIEPVPGYALNLNRIFQFGGGARGGNSFGDFLDAVMDPINADHTSNTVNTDQEFGNQIASVSAQMLFPTKLPFSVNIEYAGEDNSYRGSYRLGDSLVSVGLDLPKLWAGFDAGYQVSEWQQAWYVHHIYPDGLTNYGKVIGHWFGEARVPGDSVGGVAQTWRVGWQGEGDGYAQLTYRTIDPQWYGTYAYERSYEVGLRYDTLIRGYPIGAELYFGKDVFDQQFARLSASFDLQRRLARARDTNELSSGDSSTELFVDVGAHRSSVYFIPADNLPRYMTEPNIGLHMGIGARRLVSTRMALGMRLELDGVESRQLLSLRLLDTQYRLGESFALTGFFGAARYHVRLPAYGYYWGAGFQLRDVVPGWDVSLDVRHHEKLARDKYYADDPGRDNRNDMFWDIKSTALYLSRKF